MASTCRCGGRRWPTTDVEPLLAVRPAAIAEAQRLCPELLRADSSAR